VYIIEKPVVYLRYEMQWNTDNSDWTDFHRFFICACQCNLYPIWNLCIYASSPFIFHLSFRYPSP